jgi:hypothetical protein
LESREEQKEAESPTPDEHLARLTQGPESSSTFEPKPKEEGAIDHDKLEGLTKPPAE